MSEKKLRFSVVGKDQRMLFCEEALRREGYATTLCTDECYISADSDYYVFGLPFDRRLCPSDLTRLKQGAQIFAGMISDDTEKTLNASGFSVTDYAKSEHFLAKNALLTAEAAMTVYVGATGVSFNGAEILVSGFGRIGKELAKLLVAHGANVTISARKYTDLLRIREYGCYPIETSGINGSFDAIFNTIPSNVYTRDILDRTETKVYVELASAPYGIANTSDWGERTKIILGSSLPSKVLPVSAGEIIKDAILHQLKEE